MDARQASVRILALAALVILGPACGGSGGGGGGGPMFDVSGGNATGSPAPGQTIGGNGGTINIAASGSLRFGANPPPAKPALPQVPTTGTNATSADLTGAVYTLLNGNILLSGSIRSGDTNSQIMAVTAMNGDIVLSGRFQSGLNTGTTPAQTRSLFLSAPNGTVYITGSIRTLSDDGLEDGTNSGEVNISAKKIVVTGKIDTTGEDVPPDTSALPGSSGGVITLDTLTGGGTDVLVVGGSLTTSGGPARSIGGTPGDVVLSAGEAIHVHGSITARGGAAGWKGAVAAGGNGGQLMTTSSTGIFVNASIDLSGGDALSNGSNTTGGHGGYFLVTQADTGPAAVYGSVLIRGGRATTADSALMSQGGAGGTIAIGGGGATNNPSALDFASAFILGLGGTSTDTGGVGSDVALECAGASPGGMTFGGKIDVSGGSGPNEAGSAGSVDLKTAQGNMNVNGEFILRGADSVGSPSGGGGLFVDCGGTAPTPSGSLTFFATVDGRGGSGTGGNVGGGAGGQANLIVRGADQFILLGSQSSILLDGGPSDGTGVGGIGGNIRIETEDGGIDIGGLLTVRGGPAPDPGGAGGQGGRIQIHSDLSKDGTGGDIMIAAKAVLDASGGTGTIGGGGVGGLAVSIEIDADGDNSNNPAANGIIRNFGSIIARGGAFGGSGGDALFDGLNPGGTPGPNAFEPGGVLDLGPSGSFTSQ